MSGLKYKGIFTQNPSKGAGKVHVCLLLLGTFRLVNRSGSNLGDINIILAHRTTLQPSAMVHGGLPCRLHVRATLRLTHGHWRHKNTRLISIFYYSFRRTYEIRGVGMETSAFLPMCLLDSALTNPNKASPSVSSLRGARRTDSPVACCDAATCRGPTLPSTIIYSPACWWFGAMNKHLYTPDNEMKHGADQCWSSVSLESCL